MKQMIPFWTLRWVGLLVLGTARAAGLEEALQRGLIAEEVKRDLPAARAAYEEAVKLAETQRPLAATALFRLAETLHRLGQTNSAAESFRRLLREYPDQTHLTQLARGRLPAAPVLPAERETDDRAGLAARLRAAEADLELLRNYSSSDIAAILAQRNPGSELARLRSQLHDIQLVQAELKPDFGPDHPETQRIAARLRTIDSLIKAEIEAVFRSLNQEVNTLRGDSKLLKESAASATAPEDAEDAEIRNLRALIANSPDLLNAVQGTNRLTLVAAAAQRGELRLVRFLVENGADLTIGQETGNPPLHVAAAAGHKAVVEYLLEKGAPVDSWDSRGRTALHVAAREGRATVIGVLLKAGANREAGLRVGQLVQVLTPGPGYGGINLGPGATPLVVAAAAMQPAAVRALLDAGANPKAADVTGFTALQGAVAREMTGTVRQLLEAGADPNRRQPGSAPLLFQAVKRSDSELAQLLLARGGRPDDRNESGATALFVAPDRAMVELLVQGGVPIGATNREGASALYQKLQNLAQGRSNESPEAASPMEVVLALLDAGADPKARPNRESETPLMLAVRARNPELVERLLKAGADVGEDNASGVTALLLAVDSQSRRILTALLQAGADPNAGGPNRLSPFSYARQLVQQGQGGFGGGPRLGPVALPGSGRVPGSTPEPSVEDTLTLAEVLDLLRAHGGRERLGDPDGLVAVRLDSHGLVIARQKVFARDAPGRNRYTLTDLLVEAYALPDGRGSPFHWPDLRRLRLVREDPAGTNVMEQVLDLPALLASGDPAKDPLLEWGDAVVIPEADHPVLGQPQFLSEEILGPLRTLTQGKLTLRLAGVENTLPVGLAQSSKAIPQPENRWLRPLILNHPSRRTSSDIGQVRVIRPAWRGQPATNWVVDLRRDSEAERRVRNTGMPLDRSALGAEDLYLRDGDRLEVPDLPWETRATAGGVVQVFGGLTAQVPLNYGKRQTVADILLALPKSPTADFNRVKVHRHDPATGEPVTLNLNIQRILSENDRQSDVPVIDGDRIEVGTRISL